MIYVSCERNSVQRFNEDISIYIRYFFMLISSCIVNQFLKMFQQDDTFFFVQYFIHCKRLYMFRVKRSPIIGSSNKL
jgi:hypothetical protein